MKFYRLALLIALTGAATTLSSCGLTMEYYSSPQLNLRYRAAADSQIKSPALLEFLVFQLMEVEPEKRRLLVDKVNTEWGQFGSQWETFRNKGTFPDYLKPQLSYPATLLADERPVEHFAIEPGRYGRAELKRHRKTAHLLVIGLGAERGEHSVRLINLGLLDSQLALCFHEYDIFPYEAGKPWPCVNFQAPGEGRR